MGVAIGVATILGACGSPSATSQASPTPSSASSPAATPPGSPSPPVAFGPLVLTPSSDGKHTLVESFADPAHPAILYSLALTARVVKFISPTEIGYTTSSAPQSPINGVTTIWRMSLNDMRPVSVARLQGDALDVAWSPDGSNVAFIAYPSVPALLSVNRLWLKVGSASPRALTPLIEFGGRGGSASDEVIVRFSPDGKYLLMVDTYFAGRAPKSADQAHFQVRSVPDGNLVWSPPDPTTGSWTTMAVWSHQSDRLYYQAAGVQSWDASTRAVSTVAAGLTWYSPDISPDDRFVAYETSSTDGKPHVALRDLVSGSGSVLPGNLGRPTLLSDSQMIEAHLVLKATPLGPYYATTHYYVRNLLTNVETLLPTGFGVLDVWPH
jgi:WD40-like Beta Propeller Repeat